MSEIKMVTTCTHNIMKTVNLEVSTTFKTDLQCVCIVQQKYSQN